MKSNLLYEIFEEHLYSTGTVGDAGEEAMDNFADRVVQSYLESMETQGVRPPFAIREEIEEELKDEVLDMTRKKTYGFLSLEDYRKSRNSKKI